ncbi:MAG: response regulator transcription factor [Flavobacteriales bacterium]|jgi:DNA-binding response OmpR family regulator|nr:response regulator transcription factor [Flavobacteriales bacterium]MBT3963526.1 response regulator transcription factor [Flavobacteriales bacterium]MBT4706250.1 response regulator transcription factor [Flavobacteriales bacterium]MBT4931425.1 response regulator transcription factor [Flavobacteriales bacterium]MBT5976100.1 response regulator transcription factor [Flavobacteriales bacterium]
MDNQTKQPEPIRVLVAEDDPNLGTILKEFLEAKGYKTSLAINGVEGWKQFANGEFDCCILDVMMPEKDGFTLAKEIRTADESIPIIFLTAKSMKDDTIEGFKSGGDDYITKPFSMEELLLRLKAILRRTKGEEKTPEKTVFELGEMKFDFKNQVLKSNGDERHLTSKENALLKMLSQHSNQLLDRSQALLAIWGDDSYFNSRSMDVYIAKLRKYLKEDERVKIINEHGRGFRLILP